MKNKLKDNRECYEGILSIVLIILAVYAVIWSFTDLSPFSQSTYNSYALQAKRWLSGHLDLGQNYSYLEIAEFKGKYFISFPPIPSVILLPFAIFADKVPDNFLITIIGIIGAVYAYLMMYRSTENRNISIFFALFATIGSNFLHISTNAGVWYFAQICGYTFTMMALYYASNTSLKCGWAPLFLLALAFGCRPIQMVYLPLVAWFMYKKINANEIDLIDAVKKYWWWIIPPLAVGGFLMLLNALRFGNPFEFGHNYLPEFNTSVQGGEMQFSGKYFLSNLKRMFDLPSVVDKKLEFPRFNGWALWIVSPIFLAFVCYLAAGFKENKKTPEIWGILALLILHMVLLCLHRTLGGSQFGNRYTVDMIPATLFGISLMIKNQKNNLLFIFTPMFFWGLGLNLVGTIGYFLSWFV